VSETTVKCVAATDPKVTLPAPVKAVPVIVTVVPPEVAPEVGVTPATAGTGALYENGLTFNAGSLVPPAVVTRMFCKLAGWAGDTAVSLVSDITVKLGAATVPKMTFVTPVKCVPVTVTVVPPEVGPYVGAMSLTVGPAASLPVELLRCGGVVCLLGAAHPATTVAKRAIAITGMVPRSAARRRRRSFSVNARMPK
jgi:hypothetical protein